MFDKLAPELAAHLFFNIRCKFLYHSPVPSEYCCKLRITSKRGLFYTRVNATPRPIALPDSGQDAERTGASSENLPTLYALVTNDSTYH